MFYRKMESPGGTSPPKPKELTVSEMICKNGTDSSKPGPENLREYLVQRTMARHRFTKEQALAAILAFGG